MFTSYPNHAQYVKLAIRLRKQGFRMVCSMTPDSTDMQRFGYIKRAEDGTATHRYLNVRRNGFHNITN